jgi:hypothetical protein
MLSHHAGSARRWDARPRRLHLRHQELQVQGGRDQEDQQGKDHRIFRREFSTIFFFIAPKTCLLNTSFIASLFALFWPQVYVSCLRGWTAINQYKLL